MDSPLLETKHWPKMPETDDSASENDTLLPQAEENIAPSKPNMRGWKIAIIIIGVLLLIVVILVGFLFASLHQNQEDHFLGEDWHYLKSDPNHDFPEVDQKILACYEDYEQHFCQNLNLGGPWRTNPIIHDQNKDFRTKKSLFYCKPEPRYPTGSEAVTSIADYDLTYGTKKLFKAPMRDNKAIGHVDIIIKSLGEPPRDAFFTPKSLLTRVKDQGKCGSCVPFASVAAIETAFIRLNSNLTNDLDLAEQTLVNCGIDENELIDRCKGVGITKCFEYLIEHRGGRLPLEKDDPYQERYNADKCISDFSNFNANVTVTGFVQYENLDEIRLKALVAMHGAVVSGIAIQEEASEFGTKFQHYGGGIFDYCSSNNKINHAVTIIGYGNSHGTNFWVVKNSWGENWGENGTFRIAFNCNRIGALVVVPLVTKTNSDIGGISNEKRYSSEL